MLEAATEGARLRFRPVMMTSFAFILGLYPLVVATGASQLARRDVGTPVFGGMIFASFIGIFAIPPLYVSVPGHSRAAAAVHSPAQDVAPRTDSVAAGRQGRGRSARIGPGGVNGTKGFCREKKGRDMQDRRLSKASKDERDISSNEKPKQKLKRKDYEAELRRLHVELVKLQEWVRHERQKVCILFEGRDGAGKGGTIKAITARVSPRIFRVMALPAPTEREKSQMYVQRYLPHLPAGGEIVIFDRSWYNRAGVERVMGFCTEEQAQHFLKPSLTWRKPLRNQA